MKRIISLLLCVAALGALLCGCGMDRVDNELPVVESPYVTPFVDPSMSPMISPDIEDGIVRDRDGFIEEGSKGDATRADKASKPQVGSTADTPAASARP